MFHDVVSGMENIISDPRSETATLGPSRFVIKRSCKGEFVGIPMLGQGAAK
jgi:hypothetical protein